MRKAYLLAIKWAENRSKDPKVVEYLYSETFIVGLFKNRKNAIEAAEKIIDEFGVETVKRDFTEITDLRSDSISYTIIDGDGYYHNFVKSYLFEFYSKENRDEMVIWIRPIKFDDGKSFNELML